MCVCFLGKMDIVHLAVLASRGAATTATNIGIRGVENKKNSSVNNRGNNGILTTLNNYEGNSFIDFSWVGITRKG